MSLRLRCRNVQDNTLGEVRTQDRTGARGKSLSEAVRTEAISWLSKEQWVSGNLQLPLGFGQGSWASVCSQWFGMLIGGPPLEVRCTGEKTDTRGASTAQLSPHAATNVCFPLKKLETKSYLRNLNN